MYLKGECIPGHKSCDRAQIKPAQPRILIYTYFLHIYMYIYIHTFSYIYMYVTMYIYLGGECVAGD